MSGRSQFGKSGWPVSRTGGSRVFVSVQESPSSSEQTGYPYPREDPPDGTRLVSCGVFFCKPWGCDTGMSVGSALGMSRFKSCLHLWSEDNISL